MSDSRTPRPGSRRMPKDSAFFDKLVPIILVLMSVVLVVVLLAALAGVLGWLRF